MPFVDPRAHRLQLAVVGVTYLAAGALDDPLLLVGLGVVYLVAAVNYPKWSLPIRAFDAVAASVSPARVLVDARPSRMMCRLTVPTTLVLAGVMVWLSGFGQLAVAGAGVMYLIEAAIGRCATCETYRVLAARGVIHPDPPLGEDCQVAFPSR